MIKKNAAVLKINSSKGNPRNSEGSFLRLKDKSIMFIYTKFIGDSCADTASANLAVRYSYDEGKSWTSEDEIILYNECKENIMSVSLLRLQSGKIALLYLRKESNDDCRPVIRFSSDEGKSWSEAKYCISEKGYFVVNNDRLIQLKSGRLMFPTAYHNKILNGYSVVLFYYSDDEGETWHQCKGWCLPPASLNNGLEEPGLIELKDGRLWCWCRSEFGSQYVSYSNNGGESWTDAVPSNFKSPCSPMSVKRHTKTDELIAVWNDTDSRWNLPKAGENTLGRTPLVMAKSSDDGKNFQDLTLLEADSNHGYCYTAIEFSENAILLAYCCGGGNTMVLQDLCIRRIEE